MDGFWPRAQKKKLAHVSQKGRQKSVDEMSYARYPIIMGTVVGVRELDRNE